MSLNEQGIRRHGHVLSFGDKVGRKRRRGNRPLRGLRAARGSGSWAPTGREGQMTSTERIARQFMEAIPHSRALGMVMERLEGGIAVVSMPYDPRLVGDPATGVIHGGAVSALMDTASGAAVMCHPAGGQHGND
jgi:hypothetical protein